MKFNSVWQSQSEPSFNSELFVAHSCVNTCWDTLMQKGADGCGSQKRQKSRWSWNHKHGFWESKSVFCNRKRNNKLLIADSSPWLYVYLKDLILKNCSQVHYKNTFLGKFFVLCPFQAKKIPILYWFGRRKKRMKKEGVLLRLEGETEEGTRGAEDFEKKNTNNTYLFNFQLFCPS